MITFHNCNTFQKPLFIYFSQKMNFRTRGIPGSSSPAVGIPTISLPRLFFIMTYQSAEVACKYSLILCLLRLYSDIQYNTYIDRSTLMFIDPVTLYCMTTFFDIRCHPGIIISSLSCWSSKKHPHHGS